MEHGAGNRSARRPTLRARLVAGATALSLIAAACSSEAAGPAPEPPVTDTAAPETTEAPETTTTSTSTTTTTTTTDPPPVVDTEPSASSEPEPETTEPEPLPAPTNTMFDPATVEGEVEQATLANFGAIKTCGRQLPECDLDALTRYSALEYEAGNVELVSGFNRDGYEVRNSDDYSFEVLDITEFSDDGTEAIVVTCVRDGSQLIAPATDSTPERIIDEGNVTRKDKYLLRRLGDVWLVTARDSIDREPGTDGEICR